jgi:hypothetical protein
MQFKFKFASLFTLMMVFFLATAQNVMAQKSPEPVASIQAAPKISLEELANKGTATVDEKTKQITIKVDGKRLDPKVLARLKTQKSIKVEKAFEINKSITDAAFKNAKVASTPILIPEGTYNLNNVSKVQISICIGWGGWKVCIEIIID